MRRRWLCGVVCVGIGSGLLGCALLSGAPEACSGLLRTSDPEGRGCLVQLEARSDVAAWLGANGQPDYVEVVGRDIRLFYIATDRVVTFRSSLLASPEPTIDGRIRSNDHMRFGDEDRARLGQVRMRDVASPPPEPDAGSGIRRARVGQDD